MKKLLLLVILVLLTSCTPKYFAYSKVFHSDSKAFKHAAKKAQRKARVKLYNYQDVLQTPLF